MDSFTLKIVIFGTVMNFIGAYIFYRYHLSTLLAILFAAAGIMNAIIIKAEFDKDSPKDDSGDSDDSKQAK